jgi:1-acyl-sn-glycerol-3-phosphate acyltransferase
MNVYGQTMLRVDVVGNAPLPPGPKIIAANHPTTTDPFLLLGMVAEPMSILITEMCFEIPVFGQYLRLAGHIPVVDGNGRAAFETARQRLGAGECIGIFPEGALSPLEGGVGHPHTGAVRLALLTGAPIIPVGISLQRERIRFVDVTAGGKTETSRWYLNGPYAVTVGEPIYLTGSVDDRAQVTTASEHLMRRISDLSQISARRIQAMPDQSFAWKKALQTAGTYASTVAANLAFGTQGSLIMEQLRMAIRLAPGWFQA